MPLRDHLSIISAIKSELSKHNARLLSLCISGSHLYGFASEDSDIDYRGTFLADSNSFLGLHRPKEVIELNLGPDKDVVLFEVSKEVKLALASNCNALERITAKQIFTTKEYLQLKNLITSTFGKAGLYNSYKGMATFNYKKFILQGRSTVKKYLYVFRGLMAGIYALQTGKIEPNIDTLNRHFKLPEVKQLIELKRAGKEKDPLPKDLDAGSIEAAIDKLFERIDTAYEKSRLPEKPGPEDIKKINQSLISIRKKYL